MSRPAFRIPQIDLGHVSRAEWVLPGCRLWQLRRPRLPAGRGVNGQSTSSAFLTLLVLCSPPLQATQRLILVLLLLLAHTDGEGSLDPFSPRSEVNGAKLGNTLRFRASLRHRLLCTLLSAYGPLYGLLRIISLHHLPSRGRRGRRRDGLSGSRTSQGRWFLGHRRGNVRLESWAHARRFARRHDLKERIKLRRGDWSNGVAGECFPIGLGRRIVSARRARETDSGGSAHGGV